MKIFQILFVIQAICALNVYCSTCNDENSSLRTECSFENGTRGCCPIKNGVCCSNGEYCCPEGFQCDIQNSRCLNKDDQFIMFHIRVEKRESFGEKVGKDILCPDNVTSCKDTQTCCLFGDKAEYGCW